MSVYQSVFSFALFGEKIIHFVLLTLFWSAPLSTRASFLVKLSKLIATSSRGSPKSAFSTHQTLSYPNWEGLSPQIKTTVSRRSWCPLSRNGSSFWTHFLSYLFILFFFSCYFRLFCSLRPWTCFSFGFIRHSRGKIWDIH